MKWRSKQSTAKDKDEELTVDGVVGLESWEILTDYIQKIKTFIEAK